MARRRKDWISLCAFAPSRESVLAAADYQVRTEARRRGGAEELRLIRPVLVDRGTAVWPAASERGRAAMPTSLRLRAAARTNLLREKGRVTRRRRARYPHPPR